MMNQEMLLTIAAVAACILIAAVAIKVFGVLARIAIVLVAVTCIVVWVEPELAGQAMAAAKREVVKAVPEAGAWLSH